MNYDFTPLAIENGGYQAEATEGGFCRVIDIASRFVGVAQDTDCGRMRALVHCWPAGSTRLRTVLCDKKEDT